MVNKRSKIFVFENRAQLETAAASRVALLAAQAVRRRGRFFVALSGGSMMEIISPKLTAEPLRTAVNWAAWHVFWADERCVALASPQSNYGTADRLLLKHVGIPRSQIHAMDDTLGPADAAQAYEAIMANVFKPRAGRLPRFDLILLGIGEDGHTASLFPQHRLLNERERWVAAVFDAPKPPPERITMTVPVINSARHVVFVAMGESKAPILAEVIGPEPCPTMLPAGRINPTEGDIRWFLDSAAARKLPRSQNPIMEAAP
jgi:6-phosphogluconolactonase